MHFLFLQIRIVVVAIIIIIIFKSMFLQAIAITGSFATGESKFGSGVGS